MPETGRMIGSEAKWYEVSIYNSGPYHDTYLIRAHDKDTAFTYACSKARDTGAGGFLRGAVRRISDKYVYTERIG